MADNTLSECGNGIAIYANDTVIRHNRVTDVGSDEGGDAVGIAGYDTLVQNNTLLRNSDGVAIGGSATVVGNTIRNGRNNGVYISYNASFNWGAFGTALVVENELIGNLGSGVTAPSSTVNKSPDIGIHRNVIRNNGRLGVHVVNFNHRDNSWPIVDATRNYWGGCGGPSTGLMDPITDRVANGTGDEISAGDEPGYSNVHFDPFLERPSCPSGGAAPTPTPTPTQTPTPTPTPTPTSAQQAPNGGGGTGGGSGNGNGTGGPGGGGAGGADSGGGSDGGDVADTGGGSGGQTATPPPTPTPTDTHTDTPTATPTRTQSPTPRIEPGFGAVGWVVAVTIGIALLVGRRRRFEP